jgi:putative transposase
MQQYVLHPLFYKLNRYVKVEENLPVDVEEVKQKLKHCFDLRRDKVSWTKIHEVVGISRATYFRIIAKVRVFGLRGFVKESKKPRTFRKSAVLRTVVDLILQIRKENPTYGKAKIVVILKRDHGVCISESGVGRILKDLMLKHKINRSLSSVRIRRKRRFIGHAKKWEYGIKPSSPGEMIQIDHMTVTKNNVGIKHFQAWDPISKVIVADVGSNATSMAAAKFLSKVIQDAPFKVKSIQVDGGSEFMRDFEDACADKDIALYVLPPKRPQYNGGVERGNRTFREEFYSRNDLLADSIGAIKHELSKAVHKYNSYRPHFSLKGLTPYEYNSKLSLVA